MLKYEFIVCWDDNTWQDNIFSYIQDDGQPEPDEGWDKYAIDRYLEQVQKKKLALDVVFVGVYTVETVEEEEEEEVLESCEPVF